MHRSMRFSALAPHGRLTKIYRVQPTTSYASSLVREHRAFSSSPAPSQPSNNGLSHWRAFGYPYMLRRGWGVASRVCTRWPQFIDYYEQGVFARCSQDEARSRMFVLTCMPRATTVDLFEFLTGATHAMRMVYDELYAADNGVTYPHVEAGTLEQLTSNQTVLSTFTRKPRRQAQQLAVHAEPRKTKLVLEGLDIRHVGLASVDYRMHELPDEQAKTLGYHEDEWLRLEVEYDVVEHIRVSAADGAAAAIDDHQTFETSFTWTFESNVSDPAQLDWSIIDTSEFRETPAMMKRTTRQPLG